LAGIITCCIYSVFISALFFFLRLAIVFFPRRFYIVQWLIWITYEYTRTLGFLGYSYGITGYSQWQMIPLIQIAEIFGVWGVSALVLFPSAFLGAALGKKGIFIQKPDAAERKIERGGLESIFTRILRLRKKIIQPYSLMAWAAALIAVLAYGFAVSGGFDYAQTANIALIQHNSEPWGGGIKDYRNDLTILKRLSDKALQEENKPDMVVWPETAFVPRIYWHETYRYDHASWLLVKDLLDYLAVQDVPFLIGNDDARRDPSKNPNANERYRVDYNAALLYEKGKNTGLYRKMHLVPFVEYFPYKELFPAFYQYLKEENDLFWEIGTEFTVFSGPGFTFSAPICFEDTFGYISREFVRNGAELIVNLSNDAWSKSLSAQNQHLAAAVFRAVENRRSVVRATVSGQTCGIDPTGKIIGMALPFTESYLTVAIPIAKGYTIYNQCGDFLAIGFSITAVLLLTISGGLYIIKNKGRRRI
ncbi:MAG: apolipoprotein N-acyltransferase, partial [Treponema sp.]|nr:apolipoprotein N-acyltransferase [Treponema sp.]